MNEPYPYFGALPCRKRDEQERLVVADRFRDAECETVLTEDIRPGSHLPLADDGSVAWRDEVSSLGLGGLAPLSSLPRPYERTCPHRRTSRNETSGPQPTIQISNPFTSSPSTIGYRGVWRREVRRGCHFVPLQLPLT